MKIIAAAILLLSGFSTAHAGSWSAERAAAYLDQRAAWWADWKPASRDQGTFCISCHTTLPYALSRPALRMPLGERGPSPVEHRLLENVRKRVRLWADVQPFYTDAQRGAPKSLESRGTESVLNALILASYGEPAARLSDDTQRAFANMWDMQLRTGDLRGAWPWLNFHNQPWEAPDSQFWGACLAAIAVGMAPADYRSLPEIEENIKLLSGYLAREADSQSLLNRLVALWASSSIEGALTPAQRKSIIAELIPRQHSDGGWSTTSLLASSWQRHDGTPLEVKSDAYATGLAAFVLERSGINRADPVIEHALSWLAQNQDPAGLFPAYSPNKQRDPNSDPGRFMSDAATAFSVLALTHGH